MLHLTPGASYIRDFTVVLKSRLLKTCRVADGKFQNKMTRNQKIYRYDEGLWSLYAIWITWWRSPLWCWSKVDDSLPTIFQMNLKDIYILITISLKLVPGVRFKYKSAFNQLKAQHPAGDKAVSEQIITNFNDRNMGPQVRIIAWINNYIHIKQWNGITHLCPNFNGIFNLICNNPILIILKRP